MAAFNVISSIIMIHFIDYWGAALGTAASVIVGQIILMSLYYKKVFDFDIKRYFSGISKGILPAFILGILFGMLVGQIPCNSAFIRLILEGSAFCIVFGVILARFGLREEEKRMIFGMLKKVRKNK